MSEDQRRGYKTPEDLERDRALWELERDLDPVYGGFKIDEDEESCEECENVLPLDQMTVLGLDRYVCPDCAEGLSI